MLYLSRDPHQELYLSYKQSVSALSVLLYFTPINVRIKHSSLIVLNCILRGQIKGFNSSITTIMCQVGSYRTVVG